jgi:selenocysteine-specific elongation factor
MRHFILGTAGHVDHGKTELVKALTGRDTDRLKEEKERGISIELGFAPLQIDDRVFIGIIDAPGHERFVKKMVSGSVGIDMAILLVAGDEGVMPQTKEHLEVLASLSIPAGLVVISKSDLADDEMALIIKDDIAELVAGTFLEDAPVIKTSARTGEGIDILKQHLLQLADQLEDRDTSGPFRLPVDRVFHRKGIGVVITGSCYSGAVSPGDSLELLPSGKKVRVRELQSFNDKKDRGSAGERLAIALQGVKLDEIARGDVLITPASFTASRKVDAEIRLGTYAKFELKNRERVRIHHGASEVLGRVVLLDRDKVRSGERAFIQLQLESEIVPGKKDSFVIRKYSPARVVGGGQILVPVAGKHRRFDETVLEDLDIQKRGTPTETMLKAVTGAGLKGLARKNLDPEVLEQVVREGLVVEIEAVIFLEAVLTTLADEIIQQAKEYCEAHPLRYGIDKEELRQKTMFSHPMVLFNRVLEHLSVDRPIFIRKNRVRAGTEQVSLSASLKKEVDQLESMVRKSGMLFLSKKEIEAGWKGRNAPIEVLQYLRDENKVEWIGDEGVIHSAALARCLQTLQALFNESAQITVGDFKDACGMSRKHAIPLLEYMDACRVTHRTGNVRGKGSEFPG